MKFTLTIHCDNAAFEDAPLAEVARILLEEADKLARYGDQTGWYTRLRDINGNVVGKAETVAE